MIPVIGGLALNLALGLAIIAIIFNVLYLRSGDGRLFLSGQRAALAVSLLSFFATIILTQLLMTSNFDVDYVAHYTSQETPLIYKFTALWAGQSGSLLFWLFILSLYAIIAILQNQRSQLKLMPWVMIVLVTVQLFFLILVNFITNPFAPTETDFVIANGLGLNPLLQNATMAIHPPMLYLGFVGFTVPFAFSIAAMAQRDMNALWMRTVRQWLLFVWLMLSIGVMLGGWWAYQELGWGGYWAWDPVENASFMPWLAGTALLHSVMIQEKKDMLKVWNMVLIIITFTLCIFGTFLTRSGVMSSVHSFTASSLGPIFLGFVFFILVVSFGLMSQRMQLLRSKKRIESFSSRESGFLFNNVVFIVMCFAVLWGTLFPVISEAVRGTKITVGAPFFNQINIPIGLVLLCLTGIGPLLVWRKTSKQSFIRNFTTPVIVGLVMALVLYITNIRGYVLISFSLSVFVLTTISLEFARGIRSRITVHKENPLTAFWRLLRKNRSRYGGYIVHVGIVFMFIGFTGHAFDSEKEFGLKKDETNHLSGYTFVLQNIREEERPNHYAWIADLHVSDASGKEIVMLHPEKRIYFHRNPDPERRQPHSELDIYSTMKQDIYSIFNSVDLENGVAYLKIMINPLVNWVWFGGFIFVLGTLVALWPPKKEKL
ncbi:MAG TPA: heme lyase CcmF/NrfE family subunit [Candidatus Marinimicrobia bacterium]|nr:heme lyase CcmF/NrfE family subunit [Candidatus Neomarinimicrobiota bacterium]